MGPQRHMVWPTPLHGHGVCLEGTTRQAGRMGFWADSPAGKSGERKAAADLTPDLPPDKRRSSCKGVSQRHRKEKIYEGGRSRMLSVYTTFTPCRFPQVQLPLKSLSRTPLLSLQFLVSYAPISTLPTCLVLVYLPSQPTWTDCPVRMKRWARCGVLCTSAPARETHTGELCNSGAGTLQKNKQPDP